MEEVGKLILESALLLLLAAKPMRSDSFAIVSTILAGSSSFFIHIANCARAVSNAFSDLTSLFKYFFPSAVFGTAVVLGLFTFFTRAITFDLDGRRLCFRPLLRGLFFRGILYKWE